MLEIDDEDAAVVVVVASLVELACKDWTMTALDGVGRNGQGRSRCPFLAPELLLLVVGKHEGVTASDAV